ncbi:hypothetical protein [Nocardioides zeae]
MAGPLPRAAARRPHAPLEPAAFPVLSRIGGLPAEDLDLVSARTRATLAAVTRAEAELGTCAAAVVEACFGLVPRLEDDDGLRRRVLAGKRAAHRSRPLPWTATERARVAALLAPAERAALDAHDRACSALAALEATLEESVEEDRTAALDRLHAAIARPGFHESLVVAAPDWVRWARPLERRASTPKDVRTLLSYVARAASKTSPFSGLTTVGVAGGTAVGRARSRTSAELGLQALELLVRDERTAGLFRFRRPVVVAGGPDTPAGLVLVSELVSAEGIVWRDDRVAAADTALPWARLLAGDDDAEVLAHDEVLRRLGGAAPFTRFVRLLDQGVVRAALPWERGRTPSPCWPTSSGTGPRRCPVPRCAGSPTAAARSRRCPRRSGSASPTTSVRPPDSWSDVAAVPAGRCTRTARPPCTSTTRRAPRRSPRGWRRSPTACVPGCSAPTSTTCCATASSPSTAGAARPPTRWASSCATPWSGTRTRR